MYRELEHLIEDLMPLVDDDAPPQTATMDATRQDLIDDIQQRLTQMFDEDPGLGGVTLTAEGEPVGPVTRESLRQSYRMAGGTDTYELGDGERIVLAGDSTRYRLLRFECSRCDSVGHRIFYDNRDLPRCADHGVMEFRG